MTLPDRLYTAAQSRTLDQAAMGAGIPGTQLMERAGEAALRLAVRLWPQAESPLIVCGGGNNGGDGFVFARRARELGMRPRVWLLADPERLRGDARRAWERLRESDVPVEAYVPGMRPEGDYLVDALFGIGLQRPLEGPWAAAVAAMNDSDTPVLAVDLPSGLHADSGAVLGCAVRARATISFITLKRGMFTHEGPEHCGEIHYDSLGVSEEILHCEPPAACLLRHPAWRLPRRRRDGHKGEHGHLLVVGGDIGYSGAARMAAEAALRAGAGLVSVATRAAHAAVLNLGRPEIMAHPSEDSQALRALLERVDGVVVGPGLGHGDWAAMVLETLTTWEGPLVVDADALVQAERLGREGGWRVFTPHPGEAARLLGTPVAEVQADRFAALAHLRCLAPGHWLLKGCGSLLAEEGDDCPWVCAHGNPGMGSGGMGDVLSGVLGGLLVQGRRMGWPPGALVRLGVALHAAAADRAAAEAGERGLLATDLLPFIRKMVNP